MSLRVLVTRLLVAAIIALPAVVFSGCMGSSSSNDTPAAAATPTSGFENPQFLVSTSETQSQLNDPDVIVVDLRSAADYNAGHIPGAINTAGSEYNNGGGVLKPVPDLEVALGSKGITRNHHIIIYADYAKSIGSECRFFWLLDILGHDNMQVLNGGWNKWSAEGRPTETTPSTKPPATFVANPDFHTYATKDEILANLDNPFYVIIDSRTDEEYQGWHVNGVHGGHIPGARQLYNEWVLNPDKTYKTAAEIQALYDTVDVNDKRLTVVPHCTVGIRSGRSWFSLRLLGYNAKNYSNSWVEWSADVSAPTEYIPNFHLLPYARWVNDLITGGHPGVANTPKTYPGNDWAIIDTRTPAEYDAGHIKGAVNRQWSDFCEGAPFFQLKPEAEIAALLKGITPDMTVVVYADNDDSFGSDGRLVWLLNYMGLEDARVLNGGWDAWVAGAFATENTANDFTGLDYFGYTINPDVLATSTYVHDHLNDPDTAILDTRGASEYTAGHIPGAASYHYTRVFDKLDKSFKWDVEINQELNALGIDPSKEVITNCAVGIRSGHTYFVLKWLGYPNVRNYNGSWAEWSSVYPTEVEK